MFKTNAQARPRDKKIQTAMQNMHVYDKMFAKCAVGNHAFCAYANIDRKHKHKTFRYKEHIRNFNTVTNAFYEFTASVMSNGFGTIRNHRGTTVAYLQNEGNIENHVFRNRFGTIGTTPGTTSTHGET